MKSLKKWEKQISHQVTKNTCHYYWNPFFLIFTSDASKSLFISHSSSHCFVFCPDRWHLHGLVYRKPSGSHALLLGPGLSDMAAQLQAPSCPHGIPCGGTTSGLGHRGVVPSNHGPLLWQVNWGCRERPRGGSVCLFLVKLYCIFRDGETHMDMTCSPGSGVLSFDMSEAPLGDGTCPVMP